MFFRTFVNIGRFSLSTFGIAVAIGLLLSYFLMLYIRKYTLVIKSQAENIFIISSFNGIFLGRIFFVIKNHANIYSIIGAINVFNGGLDYYGVIFGALLGILFSSWFYGINIWKTLDTAAISSIPVFSISYLGAFISGLGHPKIVSAREVWPGIHFIDYFPYLYVIYPFGTFSVPSIPFYPVNIWFFIGYLIILLILFLKLKHRIFDGEIFSLFLMLYGILNFIVNFYTISPPFFSLPINKDQLLDIFIILSGVLIYYNLYLSENKK